MEAHKNSAEQMRRLPFKLPDFFRLNWVSDAAKSHWAPVFESCRNLIRTLEFESLGHGLRRCALVPVPLAEIQAFNKKVYGFGFSCVELYRFFGASGYSSEANPLTPNMAMIAIGNESDTKKIKDFSAAGDTNSIGEYLGYPSCCCSFFQDVWNEQRFIDTTWPMGVNTACAHVVSTTHLQIQCSNYNNMLLRWLGIRPVFHLPCCFDCVATKEIAIKLREFSEIIGYKPQMEIMHEILGWPVRWSALHGIAEIETPVFRLSTKTDASSDKYVIDALGQKLPVQHEAFGLRFPYSWPKNRRGVEKEIKRMPASSISIARAR